MRPTGCIHGELADPVRPAVHGGDRALGEPALQFFVEGDEEGGDGEAGDEEAVGEGGADPVALGARDGEFDAVVEEDAGFLERFNGGEVADEGRFVEGEAFSVGWGSQ